MIRKQSRREWSDKMSDIQNERLIEFISNSKVAFINGQFQEAFTLAKEAIKLDENCADAYQCAANVCMSLGRYYNGDQVVTITIDERNFRSKDVHFTLNGDEVEVTSWENDQNNANVHIGKYTISKDGVYSYNISYIDMAGNHSQNGSTTSFVVDQTPPVLKTNLRNIGSMGYSKSEDIIAEP